MARTSSRSKKASSPPQSPTNSRTRGTRAGSTELGATSTSKGPSRRRVRQGSAESVGSEQGAVNRARGGRKASQDLAAVEEDAESDIESIPNIPNEEQGDDEEGGSSQEPSPEPEHELLPSANIEGDVSANNEEGIRAYKDFQQAKPRSTIRPGSRQAQAGSARTADFNQTQEALLVWQSDRRDKNKENKRPNTAGQKRKLTDPQPDEERIEWETQDSLEVPPPASRKRARVDDQGQPEHVYPSLDGEEEEDSQDEGFEADKRAIDPNRRVRAPAVPRMVASPNHTHHEQEFDEARQAAIIENIPVETIIKTQARIATQQAALRNKRSQIRVPWSQRDEQLLTRYIGEHGVSWAMLAKLPGWENRDRPNFQVQLKDKARNLKVSYLKAGVALPRNFSHVRLGKKEIEAVQKVYPDYDQDNDVEA